MTRASIQREKGAGRCGMLDATLPKPRLVLFHSRDNVSSLGVAVSPKPPVPFFASMWERMRERYVLNGKKIVMRPTGGPVKEKESSKCARDVRRGWPREKPCSVSWRAADCTAQQALPSWAHILHNFSQGGPDDPETSAPQSSCSRAKSSSRITVTVGFAYPPSSGSLGNSSLPHSLWSPWGCHTWRDIAGGAPPEAALSERSLLSDSLFVLHPSEMSQARPAVVLPWPDIWTVRVQTSLSPEVSKLGECESNLLPVILSATQRQFSKSKAKERKS